MKIDVEGAELQVLEGAVGTLREARPVVAFEHGLGTGMSEDLFNLLCRDVGLRLFNMEGIGPLDLPGSSSSCRIIGIGWRTTSHSPTGPTQVSRQSSPGRCGLRSAHDLAGLEDGSDRGVVGHIGHTSPVPAAPMAAARASGDSNLKCTAAT